MTSNQQIEAQVTTQLKVASGPSSLARSTDRGRRLAGPGSLAPFGWRRYLGLDLPERQADRAGETLRPPVQLDLTPVPVRHRLLEQRGPEPAPPGRPTGGPPVSRQANTSVALDPALERHRPARAAESAPCLVALVASSCSASTRSCAAAGLSRQVLDPDPDPARRRAERALPDEPGQRTRRASRSRSGGRAPPRAPAAGPRSRRGTRPGPRRARRSGGPRRGPPRASS